MHDSQSYSLSETDTWKRGRWGHEVGGGSLLHQIDPTKEDHSSCKLVSRYEMIVKECTHSNKKKNFFLGKQVDRHNSRSLNKVD